MLMGSELWHWLVSRAQYNPATQEIVVPPEDRALWMTLVVPQVKSVRAGLGEGVMASINRNATRLPPRAAPVMVMDESGASAGCGTNANAGTDDPLLVECPLCRDLVPSTKPPCTSIVYCNAMPMRTRDDLGQTPA